MTQFSSYFKRYFTQDFHVLSHVFIGLFIAISIVLNYKYDLYATHFRVVNYNHLGVIKLWGMYVFAFLVPVSILAFSSRKSNLTYLILGVLGLLFVAIDASYYLLKFVRLLGETIEINRFVYTCIANIISLFSIILPLTILYSLTQSFRPGFYGLNPKESNLKPYVALLLLMIPLVFCSAFFDSNFLSYYPSYNTRAAEATGLSQPLTVLIYELCYGFDFFSVELFFRGFMVVGLSRYLGKNAILPMVACYAFLHFGKPMWETIGSVFGGFGLGVLAYESKNIYGGLIVHLGVAWGMEFSAFILS